LNVVTSAVPPAPAAPENVGSAPVEAPAYPPAGQPGSPYGPYGPYQAYYAEPDKVTAFFGKVQRRTPRWIAPVVLAGSCAAASAYVLWSNPTDGGAGDMPSCLVRLTTGFDCPGCGGTRAAWYLLHGDVGAAAQHHLLFVFALPFLLYAYASWAAGAIFNKQLPKLRMSFRTVGVALIVWAVFSVLRNLPFEPFSWFYV
jgi:Protein of unknown function (DUF2752)